MREAVKIASILALFIASSISSVIATDEQDKHYHNIQTRRAQGRGFSRGAVEFHPYPQAYTAYDEALDDPFDGTVPLRSAVEYVPIDAEVYSHVLDDDGEDSPFSRGAVESYPFQYNEINPQFEDVVIVETYSAQSDDESTFGRAGTRSAVESLPSKEYVFNNEAQFKTVSSQAPIDSGYIRANPQPYPYKPQHVFNSVAGADLMTYQGAIRQSNSDYKVVCFHGAWSVYREAPFDFGVQDIDPFACTHIIYAFAGIDKEELTVTPLDSELDVVKGGYKSTVGLKNQNPSLKVMIGVGGYAEGGNKFSRMAATPEGREKFTNSLVSFLDEHGFDGVMFDWEFPGATDRGGRPTDKDNFADLLEELRLAFRSEGLLLAATVPPAKFRVDQGYDVSRLGQSLDFISVTTYDLRGDWDGKVDHHAPLKSRTTDVAGYENLNIEDGINYWLQNGAPREKLLLGVPFYGRSYTLENPSNPYPGARARTVGKEGRHTREQGFMSYYEVCTEQRNGGWAQDRDEIGGPFMSKDDQWISYDDPAYISEKMEWLKSEGLGGAMIWAIDLDDYLGLCGTRWPLLSTIRRSLLSDHVPSHQPIFAVKPLEKMTTELKPVEQRPIETLSTRDPGLDIPEGAGTTVLKPDVNVPCNEGEYQRDPSDCSSYLVCVHGSFMTFSCKPPLLWNADKSMCDWPDAVQCGSSGVVSDGDPSVVPSTHTTTRAPPPTTSATTIPPPPPPDLGPVPSSSQLSGDYKVVCYFTNWAWYRPGIGKYKPEDIDPTICTHIVYGFAVLDYSNLIIKPHDTWADFDNKFYSQVTGFKKHGIKVTVAIGGWNDSQGDKYSRLVNNPAARRKFTEHVIQFILKHNFDGLDLDWEYPVCWQVNCNRGPKSDKQGFADWVRELSIAFKPHGLLLSTAVSPSKKVIDEGYDVPVLNQYMDWIAVMTYDFHGQWDKKTGHVAPIYYHPEDDYDYFNMDFAIRYWLEKGATKDKLVMGMPLYGQSFTLDDPSVNGLNSPARTGGQAGQFTRARGFLAYYEICHAVQNGWRVVKDPEGRMGPYAYSGNQWVSFDDVDTLRFKSEYIRKMGLAGGMVWALDLDDFRNRCGQGAHPLMNTIKAVLGPPKAGLEQSYMDTDVSPDPPSPVADPEPEPSPQSTTKNSLDLSTTGVIVAPTPKPVVQGTVSSNNDGYKVVCYYTNWAWYRQGEGKYKPEDIDPTLCTHIVYGFAVLDASRLVIKPHDRWADYDNEFYRKVTDYKKQGVKVLVAIGGWNDSAGGKYSKLVNDPQARRKFNENVIRFIIDNNFDGLDLDWEYPVCWQVACNKGPASDKSAFAEWVKELKMAFEPHGLLLSAAVSPSNKVIDHGYDVPVLSEYLDWIAVMCYDYHGQWDKKTGHVSPMYAHPEDDNQAFNTNFTIHYWIDKGADRKKLVMGLPMYGQSFTLSQSKNHGLNQKSYGGGEAGAYTRARGFLAYYEICYLIQTQSWTVVRDPLNTMGPYAYKGNQWVGFDDIAVIREKSNWIKQMGLGGGMIWALDLDDFRNRCGCEKHPLLRTINRVLRGYHIPDPGCSPFGSTMRGPEPSKPKPAVDISPVQPVQRPADPQSTDAGPKCPEGNHKPHETSCNKFYQCIFGEWQERKCFPGLHWNNKDRCDWPNEAGCEEMSVTPAPYPPIPGAIITAPITRPPTTATTMRPTPRPTRPPVYPVGTPGSSDYKVVCYFTNWAWYRQGAGKYKPEDIDHTLCTHVVYGFAVLDSNRLLIKPHDTWADYDNKFYEKVTALKKHGIKVVIAIGGWNDSLGSKYSKLVNNPAARRRFVEHVLQFIQKHNFDGLDLDWEYPKCWQVDCKKGPDSDKQAFSDWIRELHEAFQPHGLLLSAAVSPSFKVMEAGYDIPALNRYLDWIAVMTYDYHGHWDKKTGHVAPMYFHPEDDVPEFNANYTIHLWLEKGADRKKIIMGMPLYGQAFSLARAQDNGLNQKGRKGQAGEFTRAAGFLAYYEICDRIRNKGYTVVKDPEGRMGPYAYSGTQWVGFDDVEMIRYKSNWIKEMGLGGGMIWALDLDDFRNRCHCEKHPLLRTINRVLRGYSIPDPGCRL